jgi:large subunit ribosomal protein L21
MTYAIISVGGKQYRVREGERLLVDRLPHGEGKTFNPDILLLGGNGEPELGPKGVTVTARVVGHVLGDKVRIGKYRPKSGYRRHTGFRSRLSRIEIEAIGKKSATRAKEGRDEAPAKAPKQSAPKPPVGYEELTVAEIRDKAGSWRRPQLEAALVYERGHQSRKGAVDALEAAIAAKESS